MRSKSTMPLCAQCGERPTTRPGHRFCTFACYVTSRGSRLERFWARVNKNGPIPEHRPELGPCWLWTGAQSGYGADHGLGYGVGKLELRQDYTHRISYRLTYGAIPDGLQVLHKCDERRCVRPDHLFLGTQLDNMRDMIQKNRHVNPAMKLTPEQVRAIRQERAECGTLQRALAEKYGVSLNTIGGIVCGKTWRDV